MDNKQKRFDNWGEVEGYEDCYQVNPYGIVRSLPRNIEVNNNGRRYTKRIKSSILKLINHSAGYKQVALTKNGKTKLYFVHRLVAKAFIPNPDKLECVNHKDENKANNRVSNLEWCTYKYNNTYGTTQQRANAKKIGVSRTLTTDEIDYIKEHYIPRDREYGMRGLGRRFGVNHKVIQYALSERCYRGKS